jgi:hypothetical protein
VRSLLILVLLFFAVAAGSSSAKEASETCTAASAVPATIEQINDDFDAWRAKCVRLRVIHDHRRLLADRLALAEPPSEEGGPAQQSLAIYYPGETEHRIHRPAWETVIGQVGGCQDHYAAVSAEMQQNPDVIIMLTGLCHYTVDNYVRVVAYRDIDRTPVPRLLEREVADDIREVRVAEVSPERQYHVDSAERMFAALEQNDLQAFASLADPERRDRHETRLKFRNARNAFRKWGPEPGQARVPLEAYDPETGEAFDGGLYLCQCKAADCSGLWPVLYEHIDGDSARPYFCIETGDYVVFRQGTVPYASVPLRSAGYAEPL